MSKRGVLENSHCGICGCKLHRKGDYAKPTIMGRSHATEHHFVAERFFGRSKNRKGEIRERIFEQCPWGVEGKTTTFCYECHEELLHNPVFLPEYIRGFAELVKSRNLHEDEKPEKREKLAGRIKLLREILARGTQELLKERKEGRPDEARGEGSLPAFPLPCKGKEVVQCAKRMR